MTQTVSNLPWIRFLGIGVQALTLPGLMGLLAERVSLHEQCIIANHNLHSLYLFHHEPRLARFYEASRYVHIDGMPLVALARLYGHSIPRDARVTYVDWTGPLMHAVASNGWRLFYLGSRPGVAETGAEILRAKYSGIQIRTHHGYFDSSPASAENADLLRQIREFDPHILMVGMGMPRQETWILENLTQLPPAVILPSGAAIDYVAGAVPTPPRWAGRIGLEWAFRLFAEPKRLWRRYLLEPWSILGMVLRSMSRRGLSPASTASGKSEK